MKLKEYMKKAEGIYRNYAPEYHKLLAEEKEVKEAINALGREYALTPRERQERETALRDRLGKIAEKKQETRAAADREAAGVAQEVKERFKDRFNALPENLDMPTVELVKSGICTDKDLINLANRFRGNVTMERYLGKAMEAREDPELQRLGRTLQHPQGEPHIKAIDSIIAAGTYTMGGAPGGDMVAEAMLNRLDEINAQAYQEAPDIE